MFKKTKNKKWWAVGFAALAILGLVIVETSQTTQMLTGDLSAYVRNLNPIGYWQANGTDVATLGKDSSEYNNNGTLNGTASWAPGKVGNAFSFDGKILPTIGKNSLTSNASMVIVPKNVAWLQPAKLTIAAWIQPSSALVVDEPIITETANADGTIQQSITPVTPAKAATATTPAVPASGGMANGFALRIDQNTGLDAHFLCMIGNNGVVTYAYTKPNTVPNTGAWTHVVCTFDGSTINLYQDGVLAMSAKEKVPGISYTNVGPLWIGGGRAGNGAPDMSFKGLLDEVQIYNRALNSGEIQTLFSETEAPRPVLTCPGAVSNGETVNIQTTGGNFRGTLFKDDSGGSFQEIKCPNPGSNLLGSNCSVNYVAPINHTSNPIHITISAWSSEASVNIDPTIASTCTINLLPPPTLKMACPTNVVESGKTVIYQISGANKRGAMFKADSGQPSGTTCDELGNCTAIYTAPINNDAKNPVLVKITAFSADADIVADPTLATSCDLKVFAPGINCPSGTTLINGNCTPNPKCGDGNVNPGEACDDYNSNTKSACPLTSEHGTGQRTCNASCQYTDCTSNLVCDSSGYCTSNLVCDSGYTLQNGKCMPSYSCNGQVMLGTKQCEGPLSTTTCPVANGAGALRCDQTKCMNTTDCAVTSCVPGFHPSPDLNAFGQAMVDQGYGYPAGTTCIGSGGTTSTPPGSGGVTSTPPPVPVPVPISQWKGEGNANDSQSAGNHGIMIGVTPATSPYAAGKVGQAFNFDGVYGMLSIPHSASLNPGTGSFTVGAWFKTTDKTGGSIISTSDLTPGPGTSFTLGLTPTGIILAGLKNAESIPLSFYFLGDGIPGLNNGNWHYAVLERDVTAKKARIYIDGALRIEQALDDVSNGTLMYTGPLKIGENLNGEIDEVTYYNRALTGAEVAATYINGN